MELFFRETGEGGQPLIILHGLFGSCDNWLTLARILGQKYKVYMPDARNHGRSPHSDEMDYPAMARDLASFIEQRGLLKPVLLGHSMGGKTVMEYSSMAPEGFSKMIVADIAPKQYVSNHQNILEGLLSLDFSKVSQRAEAEEHLARYVPEPDVRQFLLKSLYRDGNTFAWRFNVKVIAREIQSLVAVVSKPEKPIHKPVLFLRGGNSKYIDPTDEPPIRQMYPQAQIQTIAGAGHWLHAEKPEEFLEALGAFIA